MFRKSMSKTECKTRVLKPCRLMVVDQFLASDFNKNDAGWYRNDLSALAAAQTKEQYDMIVSRLKELPSKGNIPDGVSDADAFNLIRPRWAQTENEYVDFVEHVTRQEVLKAQESAYAALREKEIVSESVKDSDSPSE